MKKYIIDRFEGSYAICQEDNKSLTKVPKYKLPLDCKEGDYLVQDSDGMFRIDKNEKQANENRNREKRNRLFE